ncbi:MAG: hypothetical protein WC741_03760 [Patescibacteria group bacterium]|jgi:hypothetical protein
MPILKPLETKSNGPAVIKLFFLITLVGTAFLLDKIFLKRSQDIPSILGKSQEIIVGVGHDQPVQESNFVKNSIQKAEEIGGVVLGEATITVNKLASEAGSVISTIIYENSIGKLVDQIDKLPKDQQEKIREQICH